MTSIWGGLGVRSGDGGPHCSVLTVPEDLMQGKVGKDGGKGGQEGFTGNGSPGLCH